MIKYLLIDLTLKFDINPLIRQQGIFCKVLSELSSDEIFFKKMTHHDRSEEEVESGMIGDFDEMIKSIKTFQYLDKVLLSCKICNFMAEGREKMERHILIFHIQPKRRMSEKDIIIDYVD